MPSKLVKPLTWDEWTYKLNNKEDPTFSFVFMGINNSGIWVMVCENGLYQPYVITDVATP